MVTYIKSDLEFILKQIKIAEDHALYEQTGGAQGKPLFGPNGSVPAYNVSWGLRTVDGTYNNLLHPEWGAADNEFPENLGTDFRTVMVDPDGPGPSGPVPVTYTPGVDNDGPGTAGPGDVFDPTVRTISNLLVDQTLGNPSAILTALQRAGIVAPANEMTVTSQISDAYEPVRPFFVALAEAERVYAAASAAASASPLNPALQQAAADALADVTAAQATLDANDDALSALLVANGIELEGPNVVIRNLAPDEGLSAPFNSWFTLFGQFFDHGLDLVAKGGNGTVFIPLMPDDPLYVPGGNANFMVLTRATLAGPGADGILGDDPTTLLVNEGADDTDRPVNNTTPFVDQNQTYTSHPSHQVFLRQYVLNDAGQPVATGKLIEGSNGGMATWADVKAQAAQMLGIELTDFHVGNLPLLATDQYGNFIPDPVTGFPQVVMVGPPQTLASGTPGAPLSLVNLVADGPDVDTLPDVVHLAVRTGHAFLADIAHNAVPTGLADGDIEIGLENPGNEPGVYDNELLDAHFVAGDGRANENIGLTAVHHVFHSEHNRLVQHTMDVVLASNDLAFINEWLVDDLAALPAPGDVANLVWDGERLFQAAKFGTEMQYQHLVFEEFARKIQPNINVFLVPDGFDVTIDPSIVAEFAHVVYRFGHSMLTESIDRFDPTFTENHIGLIEGFLNPLQFQNNGTGATVDADIAAGAIVRGMTRQVGNEIDEFVTSALRNNLLGLPLDLATINLARGRDTGVPSLNEARAQFYAATNEEALLKPYTSWVDFAGHLKHEASIINFIAAYGTHALITGQTTIEGKRDAALTLITNTSVGGLLVPADRLDFLNATGAYAGGSLGGLNDVDLWIGGLAEAIMPFGGMLGSTFNFVFEMQMEKLQNGDRFYYLQRLDGLHLFGEMENNSFAAMIMRNTDATHLPSDVFSTPGLILEVDQTRQFNDLDGDGTLESIDPVGSGILTPLVNRDNPATAGVDTNYLRYTGADHIVLGGTNQADILVAGIGDDTLFGDDGNDMLEGGFGNDIINGGAGDDIITDAGGDDNVKAGDGNDVVHAGNGLDLVMGGAGQDFVFLGTDMGSEVFAGEGDDFIYGNKNAERILGNEGNDWIETGTFDGAPGDNFDEIFARDGVDGHDVFLGDGGFDEFIAEGGDDIMVGSAGRGKLVGMSGFDWATYKDSAAGVDADFFRLAFDETPLPEPLTGLETYESVEGLSGSAFDDILRGSDEDATTLLPLAQGGSAGYLGSALDADGIARIDGLQAVLGAGVDSFAAGDIILGGDGSDLIQGRAGDDIIDGDKWLDVQIGVFAADDPDHTGEPSELHASMTTLASRMFSGEINPGRLSIVRTIREANGVGDTDIAVFGDLMENYDITFNPDGTITVAHTTVSDGLESDGTDTLNNVEVLRFSDQDFSLNIEPVGVPTINDVTPTQGQNLTALTGDITDANGLGAFSFQWESSADGVTWNAIVGATSGSFTATAAQINQQLRVAVSYTDGGGTAEVVISEATTVVGAVITGTPAVNIFIGTEGEDHITGAGAGDTLSGNGGPDVIDGGAGNDLIDGGTGNDTLTGASGADTMVGGADNDIMDGGAAADQMTGGTGDDTMTGGTGNDTMTGSDGNDALDGGANNDLAVFAGPVSNYSFALNGTGGIVVTDTVGTEGVDTLVNVERMSFDGQIFTVVNGTNGANALLGAGGSQILLGHDGDDSINGGGASDIIDGGAGNDTIIQAGATAGRDIVRGGADTDTYVVNGNNTAETYRIYARADALAIGILLSADTEIAVTRNGTNTASVIAELSGIEEIIINTAGGADTVLPIGDFSPTSLNFNTITIDGETGDDTVDITSLGSEHRIVFRSNGGNDTIIGTLRPQDVIELPDGMTADDYTQTVVNGVTTMTNGDHSITFVADGEGPQIGSGGDDTPPTDTPPVDTPAPSVAGEVRVGTPLSDTLVGTAGDDNIVAFAGDDVAIGDAGADAISLGDGADFANGGDGRDVIFAGAGDDQVIAGAEADIVYGDAGADRIFGDSGNDLITAGAGDDTVFGGAGDDLIVAETGDGNDVYFGDDSGGGAGNDTLDISAATAGVTVNLGSGPVGKGSASSAQTGSDTLWGVENVNTGSGNDVITASSAVNVMDGGAGNDVFKFLTVAAANGDTIHGFEPGDRLDLSGIDANTGPAADQSFALVTGAAFTAAGQLAVSYETRSDGEYTLLTGNVDGNTDADFSIAIEGHQNLTNTNFNL